MVMSDMGNQGWRWGRLKPFLAPWAEAAGYHVWNPMEITSSWQRAVPIIQEAQSSGGKKGARNQGSLWKSIY